MSVKISISVVLIVLLSACGDAQPETEELTKRNVEADAVALPEQEPITELEDEDKLRVCRAGHGHSVGRKPRDMAAKLNSDGLVRLSYIRDDGKSFRYDCMIDGDVIRTRMIDERGPGTGPGAWSGRGSRTSFTLNDSSVTVRDVFGDGSSDEATYQF